MRRHIHFAGDDAENSAVLIDDERSPLNRAQYAQQTAFDPELGGDDPALIGEHWEIESLRIRKFGLFLHRIGADPHPVGPNGGKFAGKIPEMTCLFSAAGRHCCGIKEERYRPVRQ